MTLDSTVEGRSTLWWMDDRSTLLKVDQHCEENRSQTDCGHFTILPSLSSLADDHSPPWKPLRQLQQSRPQGIAPLGNAFHAQTRVCGGRGRLGQLAGRFLRRVEASSSAPWGRQRQW